MAPHNLAPQDTCIQPAPANGQLEGVQGMPPPVAGAAGPGSRLGVQDPHHFDAAYYPQPLNPPYVSLDALAGHSQGLPVQAQTDAAGNLVGCNPFGYVPQYNAPSPVQATFSQSLVHRIPTANQGGAENLRRLAIRYLHSPDTQVDMVCMEAGVGGRFKVVIILESDDVL